MRTLPETTGITPRPELTGPISNPRVWGRVLNAWGRLKPAAWDPRLTHVFRLCREQGWRYEREPDRARSSPSNRNQCCHHAQ